MRKKALKKVHYKKVHCKKKYKRNKKRTKRGRGLESLVTIDNAKALGKFAVQNADAISKLGVAVAGWFKRKKAKKVPMQTTAPPIVKEDNLTAAQRLDLYNRGLL